MTPVRITLATLGSLKHPLDLRLIESWSSKLMRMSHRASIPLLDDAEGAGWSYTDDQLRNTIQHHPDGDVTLAIINAPLEDNYYLRRLDDRTAVISLYEMAEIVLKGNYAIEAFIVRIAYGLTTVFAATRSVKWQGERWTHDDIRRCLFDMCASKSDIVFSMHRPILCSACRAHVQRRQIDPQFLPTLENELDHLRKALYHRMAGLVKAHPIAALVITAASGVILSKRSGP